MLAAVATAGAFCIPPVPQDPHYHAFADGRAFLGIPNFWNVVSNWPFIAIGGWGLLVLARGGGTFGKPVGRAAWAGVLGSIFLVGFGSSYYHWNPTLATLFWDRLPMTTLFTSFLGVMIVERIDERRGAWLLLPLVALGAATLLYGQARDDFRFYGLLQGAAMLGLPLLLLLFPRRYSRAVDLWWVVGLYGAAKLCETFDPEVYALGGLVSGHTIKHLLGGAAAWKIVSMLRRRRPLEAHEIEPALRPAEAA
jgi:hypothetical protein